MYFGEVVDFVRWTGVWDARRIHTRALLAAMPSSAPDNRTETPPISAIAQSIDPPSGCRSHTRCPSPSRCCAKYDAQKTDCHR